LIVVLSDLKNNVGYTTQHIRQIGLFLGWKFCTVVPALVPYFDSLQMHFYILVDIYSDMREWAYSLMVEHSSETLPTRGQILVLAPFVNLFQDLPTLL
jgi:hypothetical protein